MERRVLLAIFLAFLVLYVWQALFVKPVPKPAPVAGSPPTTATVPGGTSAGAIPAPAAAPKPAEAVATPPAEAAAPLVADGAERDVTVETRDVIAVFTNRGARIKSWRLKRYLDAQRRPQELVEHELSGHPLPFTLHTTDETVTSALNNGLYT